MDDVSHVFDNDVYKAILLSAWARAEARRREWPNTSDGRAVTTKVRYVFGVPRESGPLSVQIGLRQT